MTRSEGVINWLSVSDVHLGNIRTTTEFILDNLERELFSGVIATLDLLIIAGDLFDRLLENNHPALGRILLFVVKLLTECSTHKVKLRVLEGTPSHDNKQNQIFKDVYATGYYSCDMAYVDTLSIEYVEDWGIRILYVPDKIRATVKEVYDDTVQLLSDYGIEKVDLAIMHGAFKHQLPPMAKEVYISEDWLKLVIHWILVGHVHFHSIFQRIAAGGSFDRLAQGEEAPKGYLLGNLHLDGKASKNKIYFIENKNAKKYVTIDCYDNETVEESIKKIESVVNELPNESYIRIRASKSSPIFANMKDISKINLSNFWSKDEKLLEEEDLDIDVIESELDTWVPIHIGKDNIEDVVIKRLVEKGFTGNTISTAISILKKAK